MAYKIQDMLCELSLKELQEIRSFLDKLIQGKTEDENRTI